MTNDESYEFFRSDDYVVADLNASAFSEARTALQFRYPSDERRLERAEELFQLCDLFHNVAMWLVQPASLPRDALSALDAVLRNVRHPWVRAWLRSALLVRNRADLIYRLEIYHP
jgi:hypothetical protein